MDMAISEITLVAFTTIAPAGMLGFVLMGAAILASRDDSRASALSRHLIIPLTLALLGLIASATHLGTPANALYVLTGVGRSPLSNEVLSAAAFLALGGVYWILSFGQRKRDRLSDAWLALSMAAAFVAVFFISRAYSVDTILTWNMPFAPLTLWANALASGPAVALVGMLWAGYRPTRRHAAVLAAIAGAGIVADAVLLVLELDMMGGIVTTANSALDLVPLFPLAIAAFVALAAAGSGLCAFATASRRFAAPDCRRSVRALCVAGLVCVLAACFIVRFAFYAMYMTAGV